MPTQGKLSQKSSPVSSGTGPSGASMTAQVDTLRAEVKRLFALLVVGNAENVRLHNEITEHVKKADNLRASFLNVLGFLME